MRLHLDDGERVRLRASLGLPEDSSEEAVAQAVQARLFTSNGNGGDESSSASNGTAEGSNEGTGEATTAASGSSGSGSNETGESGDGGSNAPEVTFTDDDDIVPVDREAFNRLTARAGEADQLRETARVERRDSLIASAIRDGKIPPSRRSHYQVRYDDDPDGVAARINAMPRNVIPVAERGVDANTEEVEAKDNYPSEWLPEKQQPQQASATSSAQRPSLSSRVHSEE